MYDPLRFDSQQAVGVGLDVAADEARPAGVVGAKRRDFIPIDTEFQGRSQKLSTNLRNV